MMKLASLRFCFFLALFFLSFAQLGEAAQQAGGGLRKAIGKGKGKEALSVLESKASEAEKQGAWQEAAQTYLRACMAARASGQVQKAITYGQKSFEMGEKGKLPVLQTQAVLQLFFALRSVGQHAKAREWISKGFEVVKQIEAPPARQNLVASLYREMGIDLLRSGETEKAIDIIAYSVEVQEFQLTALKRRRGRNPVIQARIRRLTGAVVSTLDTLGNAYRRAGKTAEAIQVYERAIPMAEEAGLKGGAEGKLYHGLGNLYLEQRDYPKALENLKKAIDIGERLQLSPLIQQAASLMANLFLQTEKPAEAIAYYQKAIGSIESARSLLESEEYRSSFFEDKRTIYTGMILAHLRTKDIEAAFDYSERARARAFLDILGSKVQLAKQGGLLEEERALQAKISALQAGIAAQGEEEEEEDSEEAEAAPGAGGCAEGLRRVSGQGAQGEQGAGLVDERGASYFERGAGAARPGGHHAGVFRHASGGASLDRGKG